MASPLSSMCKCDGLDFVCKQKWFSYVLFSMFLVQSLYFISVLVVSWVVMFVQLVYPSTIMYMYIWFCTQDILHCGLCIMQCSFTVTSCITQISCISGTCLSICKVTPFFIMLRSLDFCSVFKVTFVVLLLCRYPVLLEYKKITLTSYQPSYQLQQKNK